jgi:glucosamine--fructose-6-phosphate aminotransferase (isomerizing)
MVRKKVSTPLLDNILAQPFALEAVADHHFGPGLDSLVQSADLLRSSKRIVLTGMGASLFAAVPLRYMLAGRGINVSVVETAELLYFLEPALDRDTTIVLVSRSGESIEVLKLLNLLNHRSCRTVGVVNVPRSTLAELATGHILINSPADQLVAIQTYTATLVTLALLGAACLDELALAKSELTATIALLSSWIPEFLAASQTWRQFVALTSPLYILGRGPALASVDEGVLLMHEVSKSPAIGMSIPQFRHGPVEVADERFRAIMIGTQTITRDMDRQLAAELGQMGGRVRWLGPLASGSPCEPFCAWPQDPPARFVTVFETVPLQLLAYRTAEARGVVPGKFRWALTVTRTESGFPGLSNEHHGESITR